jgi:hypothetical protein
MWQVRGLSLMSTLTDGGQSRKEKAPLRRAQKRAHLSIKTANNVPNDLFRGSFRYPVIGRNILYAKEFASRLR